ncbi:enoyl-CoA hydratase [Roseomonas sp. CCTCC AB2023176]|uniref:enoyl-CoA hydratase n=1 Tax=Roseomonas sp. CCTCC AB2023176 TaxID=3342640 RepID=UPI0035DBEA5B
MPDGGRVEAGPVLLRDQAAGGVVTLTLNRPAARNGLSLALLDALHAALSGIAGDAGVRCVVIAAAGPVFCAGHDLKEVRAAHGSEDRGRVLFGRMLARCAEVMQAIPSLPQPVIAAVQGMATAAGCQLAAACDVVVASDAARFATPGVDIGLFCSTPAVALARAVNRKAAMDMLLTGEPVDAETALRIGLASRIVPAERLREEVAALAARIAGRSALAVRLGKRTFGRQVGLPLDQAYAVATEAMLDNMLAEDAEEGIAAFVEKRTPTWRDR